jgi:iron complex outermembrane receptor protein
MDFYENNTISSNHFVLVDRIIGKGAVIIASLIGIKEIYTPIISKDALELSRKLNIHCEYIKLVDFIKNREQTGRCPIESCVLETNDPKKGFELIQKTLLTLKKAT